MLLIENVIKAVEQNAVIAIIIVASLFLFVLYRSSNFGFGLPRYKAIKFLNTKTETKIPNCPLASDTK
ncbi:hypothetical protein JCM19236_6332 [Vibrio sp. JCM 19236]|nr:hypothetical protein JCM19236_6332 [Vibrio sp. JCM 19236]